MSTPNTREASYLPSPMDHVLDVAQVYESIEREKCGHRVRLDAVISNNIIVCPTCHSTIQFVCDGGSGAKLRFKYGKQTYEISSEAKPWWFSRKSVPILAQQRISSVLGLISGWKILAKGKVLYPNPKLTSVEISKLLIALSENDSQSKPSLVVVGTRTGHQLTEHGVMQVLIRHVITFVWAIFTGIYHFFRPLPPSQRTHRFEY